MRKYIGFGFLFLFILFIANSCANAQGMQYGTNSNRAIKLYKEARSAPRENIDVRTGQPDYETGIKLLRKALEKDENFLEAHQLIGEFYRLTGQSKKAVKHYKRALEIAPRENLSGKLYLDIANLQIRNKEFKDAVKYCDKILTSKNRMFTAHLRTVAQKVKEDAQFSIKSYKNPENIKLVNLGNGVNTKYPEYFPTLTVDGKTLLFTRELPNNQPGPRGQEDFFVSKLGADNVWQKAYPMPNNINTLRNEGAPSISADGRTLIFVACADHAGEYGIKRRGRGSCDMFVTQKIGGSWTDPKNLPGAVNTYSWESQPSLSADGKSLYYIRKVGRGRAAQTDIYKSTKQPDGSWGKGVPLPDNINTPRMESSVLVHPDGRTLYFSSNGHVGLGGLDIYVSRKDPMGNWTDPLNLGYPINTENNENSLLVGADGAIAYFASDRPGGFGDLDIYSFKLPKRFRPIKTTYFKGHVYDVVTNQPLEGEFSLMDLASGKQVAQAKADPITGEFMLALPTDRQYALSVSYPGYSFFSKNFDMVGGSGEGVEMNIPMVPMNSDQAIRLDNVFFDLGKATLRKKSHVELNKLFNFLSENKEIKVEIAGHTDTRGSAESNMELSVNRAKAVYSYLVDKGIDAHRMTYKGYGETKPILSDAKIAEMTTEKEIEAAHQENRRVEYRILQ